ncbi:MAG: rRNA maturation RNase YbeY [Patescibacteria group bacterium]|nr:rRNA maturation RNase YbeY [Patescibacteria group bacterium]
MNTIEVTNATSSRVPLSFSQCTADGCVQIIKEENFLFLPANIIISIAFVGEKTIKELNNRYRRKNRVTDILSFCYEKKDDTIAGELLLCWPVIRRYAHADKKNEKDELRKNIVHGLLHVFGFEHSKMMFSLQDVIIERLSKRSIS